MDIVKIAALSVKAIKSMGKPELIKYIQEAAKKKYIPAGDSIHMMRYRANKIKPDLDRVNKYIRTYDDFVKDYTSWLPLDKYDQRRIVELSKIKNVRPKDLWRWDPELFTRSGWEYRSLGDILSRKRDLYQQLNSVKETRYKFLKDRLKILKDYKPLKDRIDQLDRLAFNKEYAGQVADRYAQFADYKNKQGIKKYIKDKAPLGALGLFGTGGLTYAGLQALRSKGDK